MARWLGALWEDQRGPTAVEYALLVMLVALAIFASVQAFGTNVAGLFGPITAALGG